MASTRAAFRSPTSASEMPKLTAVPAADQPTPKNATGDRTAGVSSSLRMCSVVGAGSIAQSKLPVPAVDTVETVVAPQSSPAGVPVIEAPADRDQFSTALAARIAAGLPVVAPAGNRSSAYLAIKRMIDIAGALVLLILLSPIWLVTLVVLAITTRGKPIFAQVRLGECGRPFVLYKFRTMVFCAEQKQSLVRNEQTGPVFKNRRDPRVTRIGRILRATSIDELPQLVNVLLGHMSLVGPRPPVPKEVAQYEPWQLGRLSVKPGLTCLWQVSGRSEIGFEDWVRMDLWYVAHQSVLTDLILLARTPWSVLSGRGAY